MRSNNSAFAKSPEEPDGRDGAISLKVGARVREIDVKRMRAPSTLVVLVGGVKFRRLQVFQVFLRLWLVELPQGQDAKMWHEA